MSSRANICIAHCEQEYWLGRRLLRLGIDISGGITTAAVRQARARRGILERGLAGKLVSLKKTATWSDYFAAVYGVPLIEQTPALSPQQLEVVL